MEVLIDRAWKKDGYTISRLYVNGNCSDAILLKIQTED